MDRIRRRGSRRWERDLISDGMTSRVVTTLVVKSEALDKTLYSGFVSLPELRSEVSDDYCLNQSTDDRYRFHNVFLGDGVPFILGQLSKLY